MADSPSGAPCSKCGNPVQPKILFCPHCGEQVKANLFTQHAMPAVNLPPPPEKKPLPTSMFRAATVASAPLELELDRRPAAPKASVPTNHLPRPTQPVAPPPKKTSGAIAVVGALLVTVTLVVVVVLARSKKSADTSASAADAAAAGGTAQAEKDPAATLPSGGLSEQQAMTHIDRLLGKDVGAGYAARKPNAPAAEETHAGVGFNEDGELIVTDAAHVKFLSGAQDPFAEDGETPTEPSSQVALAMAIAQRQPARGLRILDASSAANTPEGQAAKARALLALGDGQAAIELVTRSGSQNMASQRLMLEAQSRAGHCRDGRDHAKRLGAQGGLSGAVTYMRFLVLCLGAHDEAAAVGSALLDVGTLSSDERARVLGMLALTRLDGGQLAAARELCAKLIALAPTSSPAKRLVARCHLSTGDFDKIDVTSLRARDFDIDAVLLAAAKKNPRVAETSSPWRKGSAMARAVQLLAKGGPKAAVDGVRGALLAPRWDGSPEFPPTLPELTSLASLAPAAHQQLARALARALAGKDDGLAEAGAWEPLLASSVAHANNMATATSAVLDAETARGLSLAPNTILRRYLAAGTKTTNSAGMKLFLKDPQLGPVAVFDLARSGHEAPAKDVATWKKKMPRHPWLAAYDARRGG